MDSADFGHEEVGGTWDGGVEEGVADERFGGAVVGGGVDCCYAEGEGATDECADGQRGGVGVHLGVVDAAAEDYGREEGGEWGTGRHSVWGCLVG